MSHSEMSMLHVIYFTSLSLKKPHYKEAELVFFHLHNKYFDRATSPKRRHLYIYIYLFFIHV